MMVAWRFVSAIYCIIESCVHTTSTVVQFISEVVRIVPPTNIVYITNCTPNRVTWTARWRKLKFRWVIDDNCDLYWIQPQWFSSLMYIRSIIWTKSNNGMNVRYVWNGCKSRCWRDAVIDFVRNALSCASSECVFRNRPQFVSDEQSNYDWTFSKIICQNKKTMPLRQHNIGWFDYISRQFHGTWDLSDESYLSVQIERLPNENESVWNCRACVEMWISSDEHRWWPGLAIATVPFRIVWLHLQNVQSRSAGRSSEKWHGHAFECE